LVLQCADDAKDWCQIVNRPTALVTGGAGFIGSHTVDLLLENGFKVRVLDNLSGGHEKNLYQHKNNHDLTLEERDIRDLNYNEHIFKDVDYVFHFAGIGDIVPSIENPVDYMSTNVQGTVNVLEGSRYTGVKKFIYAASSSCYGLAKTPTDEDHPIDPKYPYALSKYFGEQAAFHWHNVYGLPVNSIRIFNAYGTRVRTTGAYGAVFGVFFKQKLSDKPFTVVGDGTQSRDFLYVTDVANAFFQASQTEHVGEFYNLGAGNPQTVNQLVELLEGEVIYIPKRPGEPDCTWADISKITKELDWRPVVTFEEGVKKMLVEIENWNDAPLWDSNNIKEATKTWFRYMSEE
jgi:UDP-glucose 4-epimerase